MATENQEKLTREEVLDLAVEVSLLNSLPFEVRSQFTAPQIAREKELAQKLRTMAMDGYVYSGHYFSRMGEK